ncbi:hypothetical protein GALMADRAFT_58120 [Galerina marginata CBS 339.88]|uniref:RlpA-like protein double-psi beta-barrel domain-containing protein n=1 Tax=Galerina marginata (strain CBS 339.88) TaxID=685588 RepID=A0A067TU08_GALM3|nr:hypothetical protein GALMADRAFT_58120 [Galerina marginata CBS 339.88]
MQLIQSLFALAIVATTANAFHGDGTYFAPGLGACGQWNGDNDLIVALSVDKYGDGSNCGRKIRIYCKYKLTVDATAVDKCPGCGPDDIDLSPAAFSRLANQDLGRIKLDWHFI